MIADLRARGLHAIADLLERLDPVNRATAERLIAVLPLPTPAEMAHPPGREVAAAMADLYCLNAHRERRTLARRLEDVPDDAATRDRIAQITAYTHSLERGGLVRPRNWQALLDAEDKPRRRP